MNEWEWMRMNENAWEWMRINADEWEWMNENAWMRMNENEWMHENEWMNENEWMKTVVEDHVVLEGVGAKGGYLKWMFLNNEKCRYYLYAWDLILFCLGWYFWNWCFWIQINLH